MNSDNPYAPPSTQVADIDGRTRATSSFLEQGRTVPARHGWLWFVAAWNVFKFQPVFWLMSFLALLVLCMLPLVNFAMVLCMPLIYAGVGACVHAVRTGSRAEANLLLIGLQKKTGVLLLLSLFNIVGFFAISMIAGFFMAITHVGRFVPPTAGSDPTTMLASMGPGLLVFLVAMMVWATCMLFAPYLVMEHDVSPIEAMKKSLFASFKNIPASLIWALSYLALAVLACLPAFLGWLVLVPVVILTQYVAYRDIFHDEVLVGGS